MLSRPRGLAASCRPELQLSVDHRRRLLIKRSRGPAPIRSLLKPDIDARTAGLHRLVLDIIVRQNADGGAVKIVVLATLEGPEERDKPGEAEQQRHGNEVGENIHVPASFHSSRASGNEGGAVLPAQFLR